MIEAAITVLGIFAVVVAGTFFATSVMRELKMSRARRKRQRRNDTLAGRPPYDRP